MQIQAKLCFLSPIYRCFNRPHKADIIFNPILSLIHQQINESFLKTKPVQLLYIHVDFTSSFYDMFVSYNTF